MFAGGSLKLRCYATITAACQYCVYTIVRLVAHRTHWPVTP